MSGAPLFKHDTFKLGLLHGEMQSLILSLLLQGVGEGRGRRGVDSGGGEHKKKSEGYSRGKLRVVRDKIVVVGGDGSIERWRVEEVEFC